jgi:FHS family glucose/mannose:H+ symporter-like MFS transporter
MSKLIFLSYISLFALAILDNMRGPFYPDILKELAVGSASGSLFFAVVSFLAVVGSWLSDGFLKKKSSVWLLCASSAGLGVGYFFIALSPSLSVVLAACAFFGFSLGVLNVAQNVLANEAAPPRYRRQIFSGLHAMYGLASLLAPLLASALRDWGADWRQAFVLLSLFPIGVALYGLRLLSVSRAGLVAGAVSAAQANAPAERTSASTGAVSAPPALPAFTRQDKLMCVVFSLLMGFYLCAEISVSSRLVLWLRESQGFSPDAADLRLAAFFLCLLSGRLFFSFVRIPFLQNWGLLTLSSLVGSVLFCLGLYFNPWLVVLSGLAMAPFYPVAMDQVANHFKDKTAQAMSVVIAAGSLSVVAMHVLVGWVAEHLGLTLALQLCAAALFVLCLGLLVGRLLFKPQVQLT